MVLWVDKFWSWDILGIKYEPLLDPPPPSLNYVSGAPGRSPSVHVMFIYTTQVNGHTNVLWTLNTSCVRLMDPKLRELHTFQQPRRLSNDLLPSPMLKHTFTCWCQRVRTQTRTHSRTQTRTHEHAHTYTNTTTRRWTHAHSYTNAHTRTRTHEHAHTYTNASKVFVNSAHSVKKKPFIAGISG